MTDTSNLVERKNFGWLPDLPDHRDLPFRSAMRTDLMALPMRVDLSEKGVLPIRDQGMVGSCVAFAVAAAIEYAMRKRPNDPKVSDFLEKDRVFAPSRLFIYYGAREILGTIDEDSGSMIRDACKVVYNLGAPRESGWKYVEGRFKERPPKAQYASARFHKITSYRSVPVDVHSIKSALAEGLPVVFGVAVFNSFFSRSDGTVPMPSPSEGMLGGHAMLIVGYDDNTQRFKFLNSWGADWGTGGYGTIPYNYAGNRQYGSDYWVILDNLYKERIDE